MVWYLLGTLNVVKISPVKWTPHGAWKKVNENGPHRGMLAVLMVRLDGTAEGEVAVEYESNSRLAS